MILSSDQAGNKQTFAHCAFRGCRQPHVPATNFFALPNVVISGGLGEWAHFHPSLLAQEMSTQPLPQPWWPVR
jgi:hypothetical protein